ncbi:hypothetical protein GDO86_000410 [Hymenochirus boettgeri]|uniref:Myb/SANT-like DNA-binding domain-containing protein n=1 Tax=Hymenochirus boettgeri TaxID=247094 RepID=A0A8T2KBL6_9PIPI|nr:hypothetical protein GDO86_000410 [Hymenochirus boettgeri]
MDQNGFMNLCAHLDASVPAVKEELSDTEVDPELLDEDAHTFKIVTVNEDEAEQTWSDHEIRTLLHVCLHERICKQLEIPFRKKELFKEISQKMMEFGFFRTWTQCQTKYQNLKYEYSLLKNDVNLHSAPENSMKFYEEIDCIMQKQPSELAEDTRMSTKETCLVQSPEYYSRLHEKSAGEMNMDFNEDETHGLRKKRKASHYGGICRYTLENV